MKHNKVLTIPAFPLSWPEGWARSKGRGTSRYGVSAARARDDLIRELTLLGAREIVISSNVATRRDGLPYANSPEPSDPGVAVYWIMRDKRQQVIACDCWKKVGENIRAIGLAIGALRQLERTGASQIADRAFMGFAALPENGKRHFRTVLELDGAFDASSVKEAYHRLARERHPDRGGSHEAMLELNQAYDEAMAEIDQTGE